MRLFSPVLTVVLLMAFALTMAWPRNTAFAADFAFHVPVGERQLFLDDFGIATIENLTRTMHKPDKKGAVIRPDPAKGGSLQIRHAPFWLSQEKVFKLLVADTAGPKSIFRWYTSADGLHWVRGQQPDTAFIGFHVVYDGQDPDLNRRFKAANPPEGFSVSSDGMTWTKLNVPGIPSSDEANFSYDPQTGGFLLTVKIGGPHGRSVGLATSKDFENWTNHGLIFHADDIDQQLGHKRINAYLADPLRLPLLPEHPAEYTVDVYNMGLFRYEGIYIGMPAMHHRHTVRPPGQDDSMFHVVQLVCSRDVKNWVRLGNREPWLDVSRLESGAYDSKVILPPSSAVVRGPGCLEGADKLSKDQLWFYYTGGKAEPDPDSFAVCLAILRRDGFISLDAGETKGIVLTNPFTASGSKMFVNVDALKGEFLVDIIGEDENVLAASASMEGDLLHGEVKWQKGNISDLKGKAVSLRFTLRNGQFYSYWLE